MIHGLMKQRYDFYYKIIHVDPTETIRISLDDYYDSFAYLQEYKGRQYILYYLKIKKQYRAGIMRINKKCRVSLAGMDLKDKLKRREWLDLFKELDKRGIIDMHIRSVYGKFEHFRSVLKHKPSEIDGKIII
jgi:hypothetical protein